MSSGRFNACIAVAVVAVLLLPAGACRGGDAGNRDADDESTAVPRDAVVDLTIAETEGRDETVFNRIGGVVVDRNGRIYVAEASASEIRVFDPQGRLLYRFGRKGQGPGEFSGPCCLALRDDDRTLWVRDGGNARYVALALGDSGATYRRTVRMAHSDVNRWAPLGFDPAGNLIDVGSLPRPFGAGVSTVGRFHLDTTGRVVSIDTVPNPPSDSAPIHSVQRKMGNSLVIAFVYQPYGPYSLVAHAAAGEWARAVSSRYSIAWYGADGRLAHTVERQVEGPALSDRERGLAEAEIQEEMKRTALTRGEFPFDIPARKAPLRELEFDQDGRLWVHLSVPDGAPLRADVYGRDGRLLYEVTYPRRTDFTGASRGDLVYAVQRDSLDTPSIVRMKLTPKREGGSR